MKPQDIQKIIAKKIPKGCVIPAHNERGHFYRVPSGNTYPSVTAKLQILKDEGLMNYKMNRALEYVFEYFKAFDDSNIVNHLLTATRRSADILRDAGDVGTRIHDARENYFNDWIKLNKRPDNVLSYSPTKDAFDFDIRVISGLRALDKFCTDMAYTPILSELYVYSDKLGLAGTLDDIGIMRKILRKGSPCCEHDIVQSKNKKSEDIYNCWKCNFKYKNELVLMDVKTSNQFKDHYFFQVAIYYHMFKELTGLKPTRCFILKLSKTDGTYKLEDLGSMGVLVRYAKHMLKTNEALDFIRSRRKDNQKKVIKI